MLRKRIIPVLLVHNGALVKTVNFGKFDYIGDPCNTIRIFNNLEVDEIMVLDISATRAGRNPDFDLIADLTDECFMPLSYGGGVKSISDMSKIFRIGVEKIVVNSEICINPNLLTEASEIFGSQSIIASIDYKKTSRSQKVFVESGTKEIEHDPIAYSIHAERLGAGEILLTSIDMEGTWRGYDLETLKSIRKSVSVPIIANGGCGNVRDLELALKEAGCDAAATGSMVVYQKEGFGVLVNYPNKEKLEIITEVK